MSIALYNNIAIVDAYVVCEVAGVVMEVFGTSVSGDVTDCAVKAEVVIDVTVADETLVVFNIVGLIFVISVVFEAVEVIDAQFKLVVLKSVVLMFNLSPVLSVTVVKADVSTGVETVDALPLDAVLVLSFLVVFTVNGAFIVGY